ncbi:hypothetical protein AGABI1DRAFT_63967 [Agaricus bisporus var. burnettii JB137-S8]|uniref:Uncharacterized protein n=1 Tax=Agaricus bisporus var. burnettii (strain JB137-S8 / ATCC MYA-4627 / FGSC 10392) TaxID=597362 RepID=K5WYV5_AGABU|nr:hypothetical protein AGABI2DRAFT_208836 [Agaricus bisporus var. bisporus H97]XP_007333518.1 uncharacterized protein AGABI1DRAFT_63967 [Agaricus bisporus var. burnettii JB137-S8]EKM75792.1 hypothetical protein AGABI1DRAFT_63967 [Agaricus bisporus var. burnettii JB137-S8]EKV44565.1 hypothetical protein AGABI2DRAFT_208836 [Agaricus bisporus var. bisporus H97]
MSEVLAATNGSYPEDWDKSLQSEDDIPSQNTPQSPPPNPSTPRNSVAFPAVEGNDTSASFANVAERRVNTGGPGKRTLSDLLELHAEKGTDCRLSTEEAVRLGDVLGQWINASSSPYEGDDDFFKSQDDIGLLPKPRGLVNGGRPRGHSECTGSRQPSGTAS